MKIKLFQLIAIVLIASPLFASVVLAQTCTLDCKQVNGTLQIKKSINGVYELIRNIATGIGTIAVAFGGFKFMTSGDDPLNRNEAKKVMMMAITGIIVVWSAQYIVDAVWPGADSTCIKDFTQQYGIDPATNLLKCP